MATEKSTVASGLTKAYYDVVVIGAQLSGAVAATLLAKRGFSVGHVEHDGTGLGYLHDGFLLPYAPFLIGDLRKSVAFAPITAELGLSAQLAEKQQEIDPLLQLLFPRVRTHISLDAQKRQAELKRAFGDSGNFMERLAAARTSFDCSSLYGNPFPPLGFIQKFKSRSVAKLLAQAQNEAAELFQATTHPANALVFAATEFLHHADVSEPLIRQQMTQSLFSGLQTWPGGREGFREFLLAQFRAAGGQSGTADSVSVVESVEFHGTTAHVKLAGSPKTVEAKALLVATDAGAFRRLLGEKKRVRNVIELLDAPTVRRLLFTVHWIVPPDVVPRGLEQLAIVDTGTDLGTMLIEQSPATHPLVRISGHVFVPSTARDLGDTHLKSLTEQVSKALEAVLPFARNRAVLESAPYLHSGGVRGSRLLPHPKLEFEENSFGGIAGLSVSTPIRSLFMANREVLPGLGVDGEFITAQQVANQVQKLLQKK